MTKVAKVAKIKVYGLKLKKDNTTGYTGITYDAPSNQYHTAIEAHKGREAFIISNGIKNRLGHQP